MRFRRLELIRFGHFTGALLDLPAGTPDFHFVLGPNEAGKTTVMRAVEDLLFGFPPRTPYDFLHPYGELRVGALLEEGAEELEFRRRKGNKDTVLDPGDAPFAGGERRLAAFVGGADREFFGRMFNLGHERLAEGGREILKSDGEMSNTLFSAGSGLVELRREARRLDEEAEGLWGPRRKRTRRYTQAEHRFTEANRSLRATVRKPAAWKELHRRVERAEAEIARLRDELTARSRELRTHARIRRVFPTVQRRLSLEARLQELGEPAQLPEDAAERLRASGERRAVEDAQIRVLSRQLDERRAETAAVGSDGEVEARSAEIERLRKVRIGIASMRADLPNRQAELKAAQQDLLRHAEELGWSGADADAVAEQIPSRSAVERARTLRERRGVLEPALKEATEACEAARRKVLELEADAEGAGPTGDPAHLAAVLSAIQDGPDLEGTEELLRERLGESEDRIAELARGLRPAPPAGVALADLPVPGEAAVRSARDRLQDLDRERRDARKQRDRQRRELAGRRAERERSVRDEGVLSPEALREARRARDDLWSRVRRLLDDDETPGDDLGALAGAFERSVREADAVADRRFERAEAAGRLAELDRAIGEVEGAVAQAEDAATAAGAEYERERVAWKEAWTGCGFSPGPPEAMLEWLDRRKQLLGAEADERAVRRRLRAAAKETRRARDELGAALTAGGVAPEQWNSQRLSVLVRLARSVESEHRERARLDQEAREELARAVSALRESEARAAASREAWESWIVAWRRAVSDLALDPDTPPATLGEQIERFDEMRQTAETIRNLKERRIGAMQRDILRFQTDVLDLAAFDPALGGLDPDEAIARLGGRLDQERDRKTKRAGLEADAARLAAEIAEHERARMEAEAMVAPLSAAAGVDGVERLREAVRRSDEHRELQTKLEEVDDRLARDGDGASLAELRAECERVSLEEAETQEHAADAAQKAAQSQLERAAGELADAKSALRAFHGDAAAARLAAEREEGIEGMRAAAARYAEVRTAQILLQWALERFRRQNQEPMLRRASELFRTLTDGSFTRLEVAFDDRDELQLEARREDGRGTPVTGLSSGTEDQLFLALRVAAIEDYLERGHALPFIADDLFVNFDDRRATAGFRVLQRLAKKTQVLFFTHHEHLVPVARRALRREFPVIRLDRGGPEAPPPPNPS